MRLEMNPDSYAINPRTRIGTMRPMRFMAGVEDGLMTLLVIAVFGIVLAGILARFVFHVSLSWTTEISVTAMIWLTYLGIAIGVRDRVHVSFEVFEDILTGKLRMILTLIQTVVMGFLLYVLTFGGYEFVKLGLDQVTPSGVPQWVAFSAVPFGCALGLMHLCINAWELLADLGSDNGQKEKRRVES